MHTKAPAMPSATVAKQAAEPKRRYQRPAASHVPTADNDAPAVAVPNLLQLAGVEPSPLAEQPTSGLCDLVHPCSCDPAREVGGWGHVLVHGRPSVVCCPRSTLTSCPLCDGPPSPFTPRSTPLNSLHLSHPHAPSPFHILTLPRFPPCAVGYHGLRHN